ncbi:MAG: hypothetical protein MJ181_10125 [Treponema sp.]|nr:hypothetical protein [Treponema sp.]
MFEKIYFTILIIQIVLSVIDLLLEAYGSIFDIIVGTSWIIQFVFIIGYWIAKLIGLIWGFNIDLFPNIDFVQRG